MYYKVARQIYKELAIKHELPIDTIEEICKAPLEFFDYMTKNIAKREEVYFPTLRIPGFGVLYVSKGKKYFYKKRIDGKSASKIQLRGIQLPDEQEAEDIILSGDSIHREV